MRNQPIFKSEKGRKAILAFYDLLLSQWPVPYETMNIPTRHGNTSVIACGEKSAPPIILLHGSSSNSAMWIGDVEEFCRSYRIYAIDVPGEPGKSEAVRKSLDGPAYTEWMEDIFAGLNIKKASLVGISLGGWLCIKFSTVHPERVEKLILLCPSGISPQKISFMFKAVPLLLLGQWGIDRLTRVVNGSQPIPDEAVQYTKLIANNFNPRMVKVPVFSDHELKRLTMPTLLFAGDRDVLLNSRKTVFRIKKVLPDIEANLLPDTGHVLINLTGRIMAFLAGGGNT